MVKGWHVKYNDPIGNRVSRIYNGTETRYVVDPASVVLAETDDQGNIAAYYVYGLGLISKVTPAGDAYYYHYDALGSTVAMTNSTGDVVNKYAYGIFGQIIDEQEQIENPFKYIGAFGVMDEENGLYYMRARYYDPEIGRFISKDPIGLSGGINMYAYVGGNPLNFVDPLGLWTFQIGVGGIGGAGVGAKAHSGFAISYSNGLFQFGTYETQGVGGFGGYGGSLAVEFAFSKNKCIQDLSGMTIDTGVSVGEGGGVGIEANVPTNSAALASYGGSIGITAKGIPVEEHSFVSYNWVQTLLQINFSNIFK